MDGPLEYFVGSHRLPLFDWGEGSLVYKNDDGKKIKRYGEYLLNAATERNLAIGQLAAQNGDVFIWHSRLVHRGAPVKAKGTSRKSIVSHYSTVSSYPVDQRAPQVPPTVRYLNGGVYYNCPYPDSVEDFYPYGDTGRSLASVDEIATVGPPASGNPSLWSRLFGRGSRKAG